ncbi:MAG: hypothetical protein ACR2LM_09230 [Pyrinomonadaceae bacterium]
MKVFCLNSRVTRSPRNEYENNPNFQAVGIVMLRESTDVATGIAGVPPAMSAKREQVS